MTRQRMRTVLLVLLSLGLIGAASGWYARHWILTHPPRIEVREVTHVSAQLQGLAAEVLAEVTHDAPVDAVVEDAQVVTQVEGISLTEATLRATPVLLPAGRRTEVRVRIASRWGAMLEAVSRAVSEDRVHWRVDGTVRIRVMGVRVPVPLHAEGTVNIAPLRAFIRRQVPQLPALPAGWSWPW